jgi:hypothetical protein
MNEKVYQTPRLEDVEIIVEQAVLTFSGVDYSSFPEDDWGK